MSNLKNFAQSLADQLTTKTRSDGTRFLTFADPDDFANSIARAVHEAVDGPDPRLPSDWVFSLLETVLDAIIDNDGDMDNVVACLESQTLFQCNADAFEWVAESQYNQVLMDECFEPFLCERSSQTLTGMVWHSANDAANNAAVRIAYAIADMVRPEQD